jgi:hypothetical protein
MPELSLGRKLVLLTLCVFVPGLFVLLFRPKSVDLNDASTKALNIAGLQIREPTIDLGTVWSSGEGIQREFILTNHTGSLLKIVSVESDCGCTVPRANFGEVPNGQSTRIAVDFWPPASASIKGSIFRRTISTVVSLGKVTTKVPLVLTGFLAPDASLRVSPQSLEINEPVARSAPAGILHFKGSMRLLTSIPDRLLVTPGSHQRILIPDVQVDHVETVGAKDVNLFVAKMPGDRQYDDWQASITFAPDAASAGLTFQVHARMPHVLMASPESLVLTDGDVRNQGIIQLSTPTISQAIAFDTKTTLPVECEISSLPGKSQSYSLCVRVHGHILADMAGSIRLTPRVGPFNKALDSLSIPVVILHGERKAQKPTATLQSGALS